MLTIKNRTKKIKKRTSPCANHGRTTFSSFARLEYRSATYSSLRLTIICLWGSSNKLENIELKRCSVEKNITNGLLIILRFIYRNLVYLLLFLYVLCNPVTHAIVYYIMLFEMYSFYWFYLTVALTHVFVVS